MNQGEPDRIRQRLRRAKPPSTSSGRIVIRANSPASTGLDGFSVIENVYYCRRDFYTLYYCRGDNTPMYYCHGDNYHMYYCHRDNYHMYYCRRDNNTLYKHRGDNNTYDNSRRENNLYFVLTVTPRAIFRSFFHCRSRTQDE